LELNKVIKRTCCRTKKKQKTERKTSKKRKTSKAIWMKPKIKMEDKKFNLLTI